jgi:hypothetical protein
MEGDILVAEGVQKMRVLIFEGTEGKTDGLEFKVFW